MCLETEIISRHLSLSLSLDIFLFLYLSLSVQAPTNSITICENIFNQANVVKRLNLAKLSLKVTGNQRLGEGGANVRGISNKVLLPLWDLGYLTIKLFAWLVTAENFLLQGWHSCRTLASVKHGMAFPVTIFFHKCSLVLYLQLPSSTCSSMCIDIVIYRKGQRFIL